MKNYQIQIIKGANLNFQAPLGYRRSPNGLLFAEYDRVKTWNLEYRRLQIGIVFAE